MSAERRVPLRRCTGCMEMKPKQELIRVVKSPDDEISLDMTGKKSGRGAYICRDAKCLEAARKGRRLEKSLSCRIPDEVYTRLEEEMANGG